MTIIAWDGTTLAADKQNTVIGFSHKVTKIFRVPDGIVGFVGRGSHVAQVLEWFKKGRIIADFPKMVNEDDSCTALFIRQDTKQIFGYINSPYGLHYEDSYIAMGAGRDYALAAMHLGYPAKMAVQVAIDLDNNCGVGIDTLTFSEISE